MASDNIIWEFFNTLKKDSLSIIYLGDFNDRDTDTIISLSEYNIEGKNELKKLKKKISFLIAESFQNVVRHGSEDFNFVSQDAHKSSVFYTRNTDDAVYIISANCIENNKIATISQMLNQLNSLDGDALKKLYLEVLNNTGFSEKGGAGLGLIEIARKSGQKLEYFFEKIDEKYSMFYLQIRMKSSIEDTVKSYLPVDSAVAFRSLLVSNNVVLVYKGDFSRESILPILTVIENNMKALPPEQVKKGKSFMVLVELLQNISKHGKSKDDITEGILVISLVDGQIMISAGNWIENQKIIPLTTHIDTINRSDTDTIKGMYRTKIALENTDNKDSIGIGLINIARYSGSSIKYLLRKYNEATSFITISVTL